jgi:hypothetical protein
MRPLSQGFRRRAIEDGQTREARMAMRILKEILAPEGATLSSASPLLPAKRGRNTMPRTITAINRISVKPDTVKILPVSFGIK